MTTDPRIRVLAQEASARIKSIADLRDSEIQAIYREYREKATAIEGTSDSLSSCADSQPHPQSKQTH